jgi:hypothetical protein
MAMMHYFDYETFKTNQGKADAEFIAFAKRPPQAREEWYQSRNISADDREKIEVDVRAVTSFNGYIDWQARRGVELKKATSGGKGLNLGYYGSYIYWIIEVLIVAGITFAMVKSATAEPYCRPCDQWKAPNVLGFFKGDAPSAASAVAAGDLQALRQSDPTANVTNVRLTAASCKSATGQCEVDVKLEQLSTDSHGNVKGDALAHATYPGEALPHLQSLFAPQVTPPAQSLT